MKMKMIASAWRTEIERAQTFPTLLPSPSQCTQCLRNILREMQKLQRYCEQCNNQCNALNLHCDLLCLHNEVKKQMTFSPQNYIDCFALFTPQLFCILNSTWRIPHMHTFVKLSPMLFDSPTYFSDRALECWRKLHCNILQTFPPLTPTPCNAQI